MGLVFIGVAPVWATSDSTTYTLYRNSLVEDITRVHVATFDADDGESYNQENCMIAAELFKQQPSVKVRYWCERGRFKR